MINLSHREFVRLVRQAYRQLPSEVRQGLTNVDIAVDDESGPVDSDMAGEEADLLGLYEGVPLPERQGGDPSLPDCITIYRRPILRSCATRAEVVREIRVTLWHEVGHYLGMSEADLHRLGYG